MKSKINQIVALIFSAINLLLIYDNAYYFFAYRFKGALWNIMLPDWRLISGMIIGFIGLYLSFLLFRNKIKMKSFLLIEFIALVLVIIVLLKEFHLIF